MYSRAASFENWLLHLMTRSFPPSGCLLETGDERLSAAKTAGVLCSFLGLEVVTSAIRLSALLLLCALRDEAAYSYSMLIMRKPSATFHASKCSNVAPSTE